jgi:hypothetical protein
MRLYAFPFIRIGSACLICLPAGGPASQVRQIPPPYSPDPVSCGPVIVNPPFTPSNPQNK